jgi:hypothetical protein
MIIRVIFRVSTSHWDKVVKLPKFSNLFYSNRKKKFWLKVMKKYKNKLFWKIKR